MEIVIKYSDDAMWGDQGSEGHDVDASYEKFEEFVFVELGEVYKDFRVVFNHGFADGVEVDGMVDTDDCIVVSDCVSSAWQDFDWAVLEDA